MNKVITINLNGNAFPLEENGYEALRLYLDTAARRLEGNPDKAEIIADIEQAIADKFRAVLSSYKTVVVTKEVEGVIAEMGPVQDPSAPSDDLPPGADGARAAQGSSSSGAAAAEGGAAPAPKRLYRIKDGAMIGGVCKGIAVYFNINVTLVRILCVATLGLGIAWYLIMMFVVPMADTPADQAAAYGAPFTAEEFIRRAKEGYYEGMKTFADKSAHREWKRKFRREMRGWKRDFQREMREGAHQWGQNWGRAWSQPPRHGFGACIVFPILAVLRALIVLLGLFAVISLISTGAVFGLALPFTAPLWVGILFLIVVFKIAVWPLKEMRRAFYFNGSHESRCAGSFLGLTESFLWLAFLFILLWFAAHHRAQVHQTLQHLPRAVRHAADSVRQWWNAR